MTEYIQLMDIPEVEVVPKPSGVRIRYYGREWEDLTPDEQRFMARRHEEFVRGDRTNTMFFFQGEDGELKPIKGTGP